MGWALLCEPRGCYGAEPHQKSHLSATGGERDEALAKSVAREPRGCYGAEPHQKI